MSGVFGSVFADSYDRIYREKDYDRECDMLAICFSRFGDQKTNSILDLGCGTGNHSLRLANRGYKVTGVDRSAEMLEHANRKAKERNLAVTFKQGDVRTVGLDDRFDAALMMFAVLGYQTTNRDLLDTLANVRRHLNPGGLFLFDVWYGPAVMSVRPSDKIRVIKQENREILRVASTTLDSRTHCCDVRFDLWFLEDNKMVDRTSEVHRMRFFFPMEIELLLDATGFDLVHIGDFEELDKAPDEETWNTFVVAKARD